LNVVAVIESTGFNINDVYRARFSSVTEKDVLNALDNLVRPNRDEAMAVDARQEIDLKVGVAFTRFQTGFFQGKYGNLDARVISSVFCSLISCIFCFAIFLISYFLIFFFMKYGLYF
jgi:DNA topoisomerase-3